MIASTAALLAILTRRKLPYLLCDHMFLGGLFLGITLNALIIGKTSELYLYLAILGFAPFGILPESARLARAVWFILAIFVYITVHAFYDRGGINAVHSELIPTWFVWVARLGFLLSCVVVVKTVTDSNAHRLRELERNKKLLEKTQRLDRMGSFQYDFPSQKGTWSEGIYHIFGFPLDQLSWAKFKSMSFIHPDDQKRCLSLFNDIETGPWPRTFEFRSKDRRGEAVYIKAVVDLERDNMGKLVRLYGACQDISQQREIQRKLKVNEAAMITSAKLASLGEMASGIAHEINNPLAIILGKAQQLKIMLK